MNIIEYNTLNRVNLCYICGNDYPSTECRHCTLKFCSNNTCGLHFTHKNNEIFSICSLCDEKISKKFKLAIDYSKLRCLKKRIQFLKQHKDNF